MEELWQIEANIDDMNPQDMDYVFDTLFQHGVRDVWAMPILMKKGRMASMLCVLCEKKDMDVVVTIIFRETTTIGLRYFPVSRCICDRTMEKVIVDGETIRVKISSYKGDIMTISAEYEDCRAAAARTGKPIDGWRRRTLEEAYKKYGHYPK